MKKILSVVMVIAMVLALSTTAFASAGKSPSPTPQPPVLDNKEVKGEGTTKDGKTITVGEWEPKDSGFKDAAEAVEDALSSDAFKKLGLDPADFAGALLSSVSIGGTGKPVTLVIFYDKDGEPDTAVYFCEADWAVATIKPVDGQDGVFTVIFEKTENGKGIDGEVDLEITGKVGA